MSDPLQEAYAEIDDLKAEVARVIERADSIEGKRALAEARVFDLSNQLSEAKQNRDAAYVVQANQRNEIARLKADIASRQSCEVVLRAALEHALLIFTSMANRGRYPLELLPLDDGGNPSAYFLGKQGFQFLTDALAQSQPQPINNDPVLYKESDVLTFIGYLSADLPELGGVEVGRFHSSWDAFCKIANLPQRPAAPKSGERS